MFSKIINWINENAEKGVDFFLKPLLSLPSVLKLILTVIIVFLAIIGFVKVAHKALKVVLWVASVFVILLIIWIIFFK